MTILNASEMGKKGYKVRAEKYGKEGIAKHAELMRNAKKAKKLNKDSPLIEEKLLT